MREADIGFTVSNRTNENGRAAIFYRGKEGLVAQEGKEEGKECVNRDESRILL